MPLTPGKRLGPYEIIAPLGAGGMGEVYRARDTRLSRDVAVKALPPEFARDPDRLARFEREAKLLASLTHSNIAAIFGLEEVEGNRYLVLEFVEGETLARRIDAGPLPVAEALHVARQIAAALEAAHESGIAHRDLKPGNVMITPAGDAKVLDFGLAKGGLGSGSGSDVNLSHSPTLTHQATGAGVIMGTAAYMSPEQARGRAVDKRTDIWSFGCVLYEMIAGRQAFAGDTVSDLIARILEREPDWESLPARTPARIKDLLRRCLEKDVRKRLRDIGDARIEIDEVIAAGISSPEMKAVRAHRAAPRTLLGATALVLLTAAVMWFVVTPLVGRTPDAPVQRFEIAEMPGTRMEIDGAHHAISPDGRTLAYRAADSTGEWRIWVREMGSLVARELPGTDRPNMIFWSPDGRYLAYFTNMDRMMKVALAGGAPETITSITGARGGAWGPDGVILYAPLSEGPIYRVSAGGGDGVPVTTLDSTETAHRYPCWLPDGRRFLYTSLPPRDGRYRIFIGSLDGKERTLVLESASSGVVYAEPGYLLYNRDAVVVAHRFDAKKGRVVGEPVSLGDRPLGTGFSGAAGLNVSAEGTLAYMTNTPFATHLVWADLEGRQIADIPMAAGKYINVELSPDDTRAVLESSPYIGISELWMADLERGVVTRLSYERGENSSARWSPDGRRVAYTANAMGGYPRIVVADVVGGAASQSLMAGDPSFKFIYDWTPDGSALVVGIQHPETRRDIWIVPVDGGSPRAFLATPYYEERGMVSPDGRWMAYQSDESGRLEVYVQAFPGGGGKYQVTTRGGTLRGWSRDGRQLYFSVNEVPFAAQVADVLPGPSFRLGPTRIEYRVPEDIFDAARSRTTSRLLLLRPARPLPPQSITIVQNWPSLLKKAAH